MSTPKREFDAVVVGSGAGGGIAAYVLTQRGLNVLLLEAGGNYDPAQAPMFQVEADAPLNGAATPDRPLGFYTAFYGGYEINGEPYTVDPGMLVGQLGLHFKVCANHRHLEHIVRFLDHIGDTPLMLHHCGKPDIRHGRLEPWRTKSARSPDTPTSTANSPGSPPKPTTSSGAKINSPYIEIIIEAFGLRRLVFSSDWPVCLQAIALDDWISLLDRHLAGVGSGALEAFWRNNAIGF